MSPLELERMGQVMTERHWVAWVAPNTGVWAMGIERDGVLKVLGMGRDMEEAFKMAERSHNGRPDNAADQQAS
jgi:hypothetical protein